MSEKSLFKRVFAATVFGFCGLTILIGDATVVAADSDAYSIARGGRLYDNWFKESKLANKPESAHPSYPETGKY
jgi:hypothetical protein